VLDIAERGWRSTAARRPIEVLDALHAGDTVDGHRLERALQAEGRVWLAALPDGTRRVLKFPPRDAQSDEVRRDAFVREAWQASRVDSPDFVRAFTPTEGPLRYYAMDYVEAPTVRELLRTGPLRAEDAVNLGRTLLRAAQHLLARDLAHGDLKPDNILVRRTGEHVNFQLFDLGVAAEVFSVTSRAGTPSYLAPERFHGAALSERTEIYAIGVTLYEALTAKLPHGEVERFQTPHFNAPPRHPARLNSAVPPWLDSVIMRAITADPEQRYQNFSEMLFDLDHPAQVDRWHSKGAPLLERNPLLFFKLLSLALALLSLFLLSRVIAPSR